MILAQTITPEVIDHILQSRLEQVLALVLVIVVLILGAFALVFWRLIGVMSKQGEDNRRLSDSQAVTNDAIRHLVNASDDQTLFLGRINDNMKENLELNKQRVKDGDLVAIDIKAVRTDVKGLETAFADGKKEVVTVINDAREIILVKLNELVSIIHEVLGAEKQETQANFQRLEGKLDEALTLLKHPQTPPIPPSLPPVSSVPSLPSKTPAMFLYEDWKQSALYYEIDNAPGIRWVRANSVEGAQGLKNDARVASDIVEYQGAKVLKLTANPDGKYPLSVGARVVLTDEKKWTALQPYAGKTLYIRYWLMWPSLPVLDEQGGTAGRWCTAGFQIKDNPDKSALYQMNVDALHKPFLQYRDGPETRLSDFAYKANTWHRFDLAWKMTAGNDGMLEVAIDGAPAWKATGRSAAASGFASFHLLLYTDALRAPTELLIGPVVMSTEPIP